MATLDEMARVLREKNPENHPMYLQWMAEQWWPGAEFLNTRTNMHNGGSRVGGRAAGGFAGRLEKRKLLRIEVSHPRNYTWVLPDNVEVTGSPVLSSSPRGLPGYSTEDEK